MADLARIEEALQPVLSQEAVELVDLRYLQSGGGWVLRVFVDKHGGITLADCESLSKRIGGILDTTDAITHAYKLEVSSPGLNRIVKKEKDFIRFSGHRIKIKLKIAQEGRRRFSGFLKGIEAGKVLIENDGEAVSLDLSSIDEARLDPDVKV